MIRSPLQFLRRALSLAAGFALLLCGSILIPLPGFFGLPLVIFGLTLLAVEYDWARRLLDYVKAKTVILRKSTPRKDDPANPQP